MDWQPIYLQTIITIAIPIIYGFLFMVYFIINWMRKKFEKSFNFMEKTISTFTVTIFMAQPAIFISLFVISHCHTLDPGTSFIKSNIDESCLSEFYQDFYQKIIIPTFVILGIILPLISFGIIFIYDIII